MTASDCLNYARSIVLRKRDRRSFQLGSRVSGASRRSVIREGGHWLKRRLDRTSRLSAHPSTRLLVLFLQRFTKLRRITEPCEGEYRAFITARGWRLEQTDNCAEDTLPHCGRC